MWVKFGEKMLVLAIVKTPFLRFVPEIEFQKNLSLIRYVIEC